MNTDNRLISNTTLTNEMILANNIFDFSLGDFKNLTVMAMKSAFIDEPIKQERVDLILNQYEKFLV